MPIDVALNELPQNPKVCLITIVQPGQSDSVLKVWPAEHEEEKIWLDNTPQIERWEAIQRLLNNHAEKGTRIPEPARWHSDPKQLLSPTLKKEDIPLVKLDGVALKAPPPEERLSLPNQNPPNVMDLGKKVADLTGIVSALATQISHMSQAMYQPNRRAEEEIKKEPRGDFKVYSCDVCDKKFTNLNVKRMHEGRFHKEAKNV